MPAAPVVAPVPVYYPPAVYGTPTAAIPVGPEYGGFWLRVVAYFVDSLVMMPLGAVGFVLLGGTVLANLEGLRSESPDPRIIASLVAAYGGFILITLIGAWLYHALMESSRYQGTLGKKAMGLIVTDLNGHRISFGRASGRFFGKMITGMTMGIGYAMAGFTEKRQCLHDMIAGCLVVKK
ncbi:MAG: RDD family protein [Bryobacteraceae bacterium]